MVNDSTLTITGNNGNYLGMDSALNIIDGSVVVGNSPYFRAKGSVFSFGGEYEGEFFSAGAKSLEMKGTSWFGFDKDVSLNFAFDQTNFSTEKDASNAPIHTDGSLGYLYAFINLDFTNAALEGLEDGSYYVSLISYDSGYFANNMSVESISQNLSTSLAEGLELLGLEIDNSGLYAKLSVTSVPEPSTCAAIVAVLALLFAACRRRG